MAQQTFKGLVAIPDFGHSSLDYENSLLDADGEKYGAVFRIPVDADGKDIAKIGFLTGTVTTGDTLKIGIYTVDAATGDPTASAYKSMVAGTQVVGDGDDNTWFTVSLGTVASSIVAGDVVAVVVEFNSYVAGNLNIKYSSVTSFGGNLSFPYVNNNTGSWVKDNEAPIIALEYSDGSYSNIGEVFAWTSQNTSVNFDNTSDPDHRGLKFQLPFPVRMVGVWARGDFDGDLNIKLYDSDGTSVLETLSVDANIRHLSARNPQTHMLANAHSLSKDVYYRVVIEPTSATGIDFDEFDVDTAAIMDSLSGGQLFHYTEKKDAGWTDTTTKRPAMGILIDGFDDGVSTGAGATWFAGE